MTAFLISSRHRFSFPLIRFAMASTYTTDELTNMIKKAFKQHQEGKLDEAINSYEHVIPHVSGKMKASLSGNAGALYMTKGEYDQARSHFEVSVDADGDNPSAHYNLAVILTSKFEEHGKAIRHCGTAIKLDKSNHKAYHLMGNILQTIGRPDEAGKYFILADNFAKGDIESPDPEGSKDYSIIQDKLSELAIFQVKTGDVIEKQIDGATFSIRCLSSSPRIFHISNMLSPEECNHIVNLGEESMEPSFVMGGEATAEAHYKKSRETAGITSPENAPTSNEVVDPALYRSSFTAWLPQNAVLDKLQQRLSQLLEFPLTYLKLKSEELQVVKYPTGGQFKVHQDSSAFNPRLFTALLYMNSISPDMNRNVEGGGETWFPYAGESGLQSVLSGSNTSTIEAAIQNALETYEGFEANRKGTENRSDYFADLPGIRVKPVQGSCVVFFNHDSKGTLDPLAVHAGLPVKLVTGADAMVGTIKEKWVANYWVEWDQKQLLSMLKG